jgi:hypothetical protein
MAEAVTQSRPGQTPSGNVSPASRSHNMVRKSPAMIDTSRYGIDALDPECPGGSSSNISLVLAV